MKFLAFEGVDGSGKSTLLNRLSQELTRRRVSFQITREPGGTPLAEDIRQLLLRTDSEVPVPRTELLLYQAGRAQHVEQVIKPALKKGQWVLSDRFYASTLAFQCGGRGLNEEPVRWLNDYAVDGCHPDLWVLVDVDVEESQRRRAARTADRFEREKSDFHERVRARYLKLAKETPLNWLILNGQNTPEQLLKELVAELEKRKWLS